MNFSETSSSFHLIHFRTKILLVVFAFTLSLIIFDFLFLREFWAAGAWVCEGIVNWIEARLRGYLDPAERSGAEELRDAVTAHEGVEAAGAPGDAPHHLLGA